MASTSVAAPGKWLMIVRERHLVFASWPVTADGLRPLVPPGLELDTFDGRPWITVEMLTASMMRLRGLPPSPVRLEVPQMNVRTYVRCQGERGIHFLSMEVPWLFGWGIVRWLSRMPVHQATVVVSVDGDNYHAESLRITQQPEPPRFAFSGRITGAPAWPEPGGLDAFLLNQTTLFSARMRGPIRRAVVDHRPHVVQPIEGQVEIDTLTAALGLTVGDERPRLSYCPGDDSRAWASARVR